MPSRQELREHDLLSPSAYDEDVTSPRTLSEQDSDSEDDEFLRVNRSSMELARHDKTVLEEEEEMEKLLVRSGPADGLRRIFSPTSGPVRIGKRDRSRRRERKRSIHGKPHQAGDLMFEMEEGFREFSDDDSVDSFDLNEKEMDGWQDQPPKRGMCVRLLLPFSAIVVLFFILLLGAYKASKDTQITKKPKTDLLSNGTALFAPTTIIVSLDGFRADFLNRGLTPTLSKFIAEGVSPRYMIPSFPSVTFPNHFTLVTGLYPESHGMIANDFYDPNLDEYFRVQPGLSDEAKWWTAEPIWATAEKQGIRTAIHMWPGSEAHIGNMDPTFYDKFNDSEVLSRKVDRVMEFLDFPGEESDDGVEKLRPQFIATYVPNVDTAGHRYGPNSTEIRSVITYADEMLAGILEGLEARNLTKIINIVVVSDHGMATTSTTRTIQLEDLIDINLVEYIDGWPLRGLRPKKPEDLEILKAQLAEKAENFSDAIEIYTKETMPERYHFTKNDRIAPLWVIPKAGWAVVERPDFDVQEALDKDIVYTPRGIHGYDNYHPLMRAIFVARGPAFPHPPNSRVAEFENVNVYNLICDSIGIEPVANNGTLHLPFTPVGLHSDDDAPTLDTPADPPQVVTTSRSTSPSTSTTSTSLATPAVSTPSQEPTSLPPADVNDEADNSADNADDTKSSLETFYDGVKDTLNSIKDWFGQLFSAEKDNHPPSQT
ncbi:Type I phosphodiesterase / nucleotide pyrophosphatase family protein [Talaromyces stipitatus ATCC 10500]|uniref:Type I phosphodiesterase / nucleotide pyrophosphatase family protein n=1 Tax=Talaromyces stipitatus (strain ATCC 10500 / CBS 375.48 / QM 6759 / NRRL 1006) TaxID=441959 RepID=B8MRV3_TALSN|nr:Type I phosphodiesterase / nucleotide pyrophosphatase family protein [Talaromyces stipitatus ATCC 10500]EED13289.1 Type I phosphodiesterase / nucleotide pyrophosphatase family protein [Talaromyces stipitatus ATCC 10500]